MLIRLGAANLFPYISGGTRKGKHLDPVVAADSSCEKQTRLLPHYDSRKFCIWTLIGASLVL